ncbi:MAG: glycosyltransferase family 4 protein [Gemmatimonadota bacterium]
MTGPVVHLVVPGSLEQRTGGYLYDARMASEMRARGRRVTVHELSGTFPEGDDEARSSLDAALASVDAGGCVVVDGLAGGGLPDVLAAHADRLGIVALVHHPLADETGLDSACVARFHESEKAALAACRGVVVTSRFTAGRLTEFGVATDRVRVAVPGTEPAEPATGPGDDAPPRLLCVGSLTPRKGHDVLVDALAKLPDLEWTCVLAGSEAYDPAHALAVRERVRARQLEGRITFVGELDASTLDAHYRRATLFVLASHYEGYGMALTEAIARGLPVVSTTGGAIPFTVPDEAGVLVPPGDADALAGALRSLLTDRKRLNALAAGALRASARLPDWTRASRDFEAAVDALATARIPGTASTPS